MRTGIARVEQLIDAYENREMCRDLCRISEERNYDIFFALRRSFRVWSRRVEVLSREILK